MNKLPTLTPVIEQIVGEETSLRSKKYRLLLILKSIQKNYKDVAKKLSLRSPMLLKPMLVGEVKQFGSGTVSFEVSMMEGTKRYTINTTLPVTIRVTLDGEKTKVEAKTFGKSYQEIMNNDLHVVCKKIKF